MKTQVGERRLYLKDSENKCSALFPSCASFGMIHDAPMWRIAAILPRRGVAVTGKRRFPLPVLKKYAIDLERAWKDAPLRRKNAIWAISIIQLSSWSGCFVHSGWSWCFRQAIIMRRTPPPSAMTAIFTSANRQCISPSDSR